MIFRRKRNRGRPTGADAESTGASAAPDGGSPTTGATEPTGAPASPGEGSPTNGGTEPSGEPETPERGLISETRAALAPVKKRHILIASAGLMGFLFAGTLLFAAASFWWTSQPSFCGRCHVMEPYISAWQESAHKDVNCESCHLTPGFFGFIGGKIAGLQVVANYIRGDYEDWSFNAAVSNASCLQCHEDILSKNVHDPEAGIVVSHRDILENGGKCMFCHSTVAHGSAVPAGSATHPTMTACLKCHNDKIAPLDCDLCHVGKRPEATPPPEGG